MNQPVYLICYLYATMNQKYRKEDIIAIGGELMRKRGYHATGINDILKEAGIPKGSFYNFFPTKEAFSIAVLRWYGGRMQRAMIGIFQQQGASPMARIQKFYRLMITGNKEEGYRFGCLLNNLSIEVAGLSDVMAEETDRMFQLWLDEIEAVVAVGQQQGEITDQYPARDIAEFIHTSFFGAFARMKSVRDASPLLTVFAITMNSIRT